MSMMDASPRQPHAVLDLPSRRWKGEKIIRLLDLSPRSEPWHVLEIGTGSGGIAHYLATHRSIRCDVTSVDVVDVRCVREGYSFQLVGGTTLPFQDGAFDVVISNHVIEHVGGEEAQRDHLRQCGRVLACTGRGYLAVPNRWMVMEPHFKLPFLSWIPRRLAHAYVRTMGKGRYYDCEPLTSPQLERLMEEAGLSRRNMCIRALRETLAIEGTRTIGRAIAGAVPDAAWRLASPCMPTLIYRFSHGDVP